MLSNSSTHEPSPRRQDIVHSGGESDDIESTAPESLRIPNPMVPEQPVYMQDVFGNPRHLGHSSTFSFSRQLLSIVRQHPHFGDAIPTPMSFDAESYRIDASTLRLSTDDLTGLPSLELALFYIQVLKFKTNSLFHLFDETSFTMRLEIFYEDLAAAPRTSLVWYIHYLLLMAFGKALSTQSQYGNVAGLELFNRALRLLPDATVLWSDFFTAIEVLCSIGLYLYSLDHRSAGYMYVSHFAD